MTTHRTAPSFLVHCCGTVVYLGPDRVWAEEITADRQDNDHKARLFMEVLDGD